VLTACVDPQNSEQFQRQVKRAHECREMQEKLVSKQALTAERVDEVTKTLDQAGCTAHLQAR
jgi:cysteine synthase